MHDRIQLNFKWLRGLADLAVVCLGKKICLSFIMLSLSACTAQTIAQVSEGGVKAPNTEIEHLSIDTAHSNIGKALDAFKNKAGLCQPAELTIYYAFGQTHLEIKPNATRCMLLIKAQGELGKSEQPLQLDCIVTTIHEIDWLIDHKQVRQAPPIQALGKLEHCRKYN